MAWDLNYIIKRENYMIRGYINYVLILKKKKKNYICSKILGGINLL